jgi:hypothetical protein
MDKTSFSYIHRPLEINDSTAYPVIDILSQIAFDKYKCKYCNDFCINCKLFEIQVRSKWDKKFNRPDDCLTTLESREDEMDHYTERLHKAALFGSIDIWDEFLDKVIAPFHSNERQTTIQDMRTWVKRGYLLKSDLQTFCQRERIELSFIQEEKSEFHGEIQNTSSVSDENSIHHEKIELPSSDVTQNVIEINENQSISLSQVDVPNENLNKIHHSEIKFKKPVIGTFSRHVTYLAASQIEQKSGRQTNEHEVMALLQEWASVGRHARLVGASKNGVMWLVSNKSKPQEYDLEACRKALKDWRDMGSFTPDPIA